MRRQPPTSAVVQHRHTITTSQSTSTTASTIHTAVARQAAPMQANREKQMYHNPHQADFEGKGMVGDSSSF